MQQLLIVDSDTAWTTTLKEFLTDNGFVVAVAASAKAAMKVFHQTYPCMVLLELTLPKRSGESFCQWIRANQTADVSIIMVTNKVNVEDKINGLTIWAVVSRRHRVFNCLLQYLFKFILFIIFSQSMCKVRILVR